MQFPLEMDTRYPFGSYPLKLWENCNFKQKNAWDVTGGNV